ncbi:hypothetical protein [Candidatus Nitrososphaera gargensis]|nr:hypothetical protein [Candidatus Nitrososphaera gargensis]
MKCSLCGIDTGKAYQCDHTEGKDMCKECYQEIHWLLTSSEQKKTLS